MNLSPMEFRCVRNLYENNSMSAHKLATNLGVTRPRITSLLNKLEQKNIIQRVIDEKDRRNIIVTLSKNGKEFASSMCKEYRAFHKEILEAIGRENMEELFSTFSRFHKVLSNFLVKNKL